MKIAERIILVTLLLVLLAGAAWIYFAVQQDHQEKLDGVARGEFEIREAETVYTEDNWQALYPNTVPARIGSTTVEASVADSLPERIQGLSGTPFLPDNVVKLFVFGSPGSHSIWMKDMQYSLDILWLDEAGLVVHIEEDIAPETFPDSFSSPIPAWYVLEANAGFVAQHSINVGDDFVVLAE